LYKYFWQGKMPHGAFPSAFSYQIKRKVRNSGHAKIRKEEPGDQGSLFAAEKGASGAL
jgi:hypothetical protein